jgi:hypothetical protein
MAMDADFSNRGVAPAREPARDMDPLEVDPIDQQKRLIQDRG